MKDKWDKLKILSEILKNNWPLVLMGITAITSASGNIMQYFEKDEIIKVKDEQIAAIANHFTPEKQVEVHVERCETCNTGWKTEIIEIKAKLKKYDRNLKDFHGVE